MPARQLLDSVWLVGSGTDEVAMTDPHDCHCYLVWDGRGGFLVDAGTGLAARRWLDNVRDVCDTSRLGGLLLSHYHADHGGGAAAAQAAGIRVFGHPTTAGALRIADESRTQLRRAREAGIYPANYRLRPADVEPLETDRSTESGGVLIQVIDAPGHCDGHIVFLLDHPAGRVMFSGDCLFSEGRVSLQAIPDCRLDDYASTVVALAEMAPELLLPGHGDLVLGGAAEAVDRAAAAFRRLVPPPNFLSPW